MDSGLFPFIIAMIMFSYAIYVIDADTSVVCEIVDMNITNESTTVYMEDGRQILIPEPSLAIESLYDFCLS